MNDQDPAQTPPPAVEAQALPPEQLPQLEELVRDPVKLREITFNPTATFERVKATGDVDEDQLGAELMHLKDSAIKEIIAPEGMAEASKVVVERTAEDAEGMLGISDRVLSQVEEELKAGLQKFERTGEEVYQARRLLMQVRDFLDHGNTNDIEPARAAVRRLHDFQDSYGRSQRAVSAAYEEGSTGVRIAYRNTEETADRAKQGFNEIYRLEDEATTNPASMHFDGVEERVATRGAGSIAEHKNMCDQEVAKADQFVGSLKTGAEEVSQEMSLLARRFHNPEAVHQLPNANRLSDAIEYLSSSIYKIGQYGPQMKRMAEESWQELDMMMRRIETGMTGVQAQGKKDIDAIAQNRGRIKALRGTLQDALQ